MLLSIRMSMHQMWWMCYIYLPDRNEGTTIQTAVNSVLGCLGPSQDFHINYLTIPWNIIQCCISKRTMFFKIILTPALFAVVFSMTVKLWEKHLDWVLVYHCMNVYPWYMDKFPKAILSLYANSAKSQQLLNLLGYKQDPGEISRPEWEKV